MFNFKKTVTATILITLLLGMASASPANVDIFPSQSSTRIDHFTEYEVTIENTGPTKDIYDITSSNTEEIRIKPERVSLEPGTEETVNLWYDPRIDKEEGTYSFSVTATSQASGQSYNDQATVSVIKEHKVDVSVDQKSRNACLGENAHYRLQVTNNGIQQESFNLRTDKGSLSTNKVDLEDGETQNVTLTISSNSPVKQNFNVVASSAGESYADDIQNIDFQAERCWASEVSITPESKESAAKTETEFDVTVRNTGTKSDDFVLSSNSGELEDTNMEIGAKSSKTTTLTATPQELGQQNIKVTAESEVTSSDTATLDTYNGMNMEVTVPEETRACENENSNVETEIENTGEATETYSLSSSIGELESDSVELEAGETEEVDVEINSSARNPGTYPVRVTATAESFGEPEKTATSQLVIENCWDLNMKVVPALANIGENESIIYEINLQNNGTKENTYDLSEDGPSWVSIKPSSVTVQPSETKKAYIYAGIPYDYNGTMEITSEAEGTEITRSQTVTLTSEDAEEAREGRGSLTGSAVKRITGLFSSVKGAGSSQVFLSIIIGLGITALVILREW